MTALRPPAARDGRRWDPGSDLGHGDAVADTEVVMAAIADLLPTDARTRRVPTAEELARTRPSA